MSEAKNNIFEGEFSKRLGRLTRGQLQAALDRLDLGEIESAEPAPGGLFGMCVFVTATSGEWVLRGNPFWPGQLRKEATLAKLLHERTQVPAPWPYHVELAPDLFGWPWGIMKRLQGVYFDDSLEALRALSEDEQRSFARAVGSGLAELQSLTWPHPAEWSNRARTFVPFQISYQDWTLQFIRENLLEARRASGRTTSDDIAWVEEVWRTAEPAMNEPFMPTYAMQDFKLGNLLFELNASQWRLCGVFDLVEPHMGHPELDLARISGQLAGISPDLAHEFIAGWTGARPPLAGLRERLPVWILRDDLINWAYGQGHGWFKDNPIGLREWSEPHMSFEGRP
jgi:hygromycin-B 7''-O-kinase